jgi:hypothetical protein
MAAINNLNKSNDSKLDRMLECDLEAYEALKQICNLSERLYEQYTIITEIFDKQFVICLDNLNSKERRTLLNCKNKFQQELTRMYNISNHCANELEFQNEHSDAGTNIHDVFDVAVNGYKKSYCYNPTNRKLSDFDITLEAFFKMSK